VWTEDARSSPPSWSDEEAALRDVDTLRFSENALGGGGGAGPVSDGIGGRRARTRGRIGVGRRERVLGRKERWPM
jgi:hypothetical protein